MATDKAVDPKKFGLHYRTVLQQLDPGTLALVMDRKSRIIMADGRKILEKIEKIQQVQPETRVVLKTSAPVCSKTLALLKEHGVAVLPLAP